MTENFRSSFSENLLISDYGYTSPDINSCNFQVISETTRETGRHSASMDNVLDSYITSKAVPIVLRKRILYERSFLI